MAIERHTEDLVRREMKFELGENAFGKVYAQGEETPNSDINLALREAGGKPAACALSDFSQGGNGRARPEYVITLNKDLNTVIVVECKRSTAKHESAGHDRPRDFAVDGALYYGKYLARYFNVIAVGISGAEKVKAGAWHFVKGSAAPTELVKSRGIILEPENYLKLVRGERMQKEFRLEEISQTAIDIHNSLRTNKITEKLKPLFVAGILIALQDEGFCNDYANMTSFTSLKNNCLAAIESVLSGNEIESQKVREICGKFSEIGSAVKLRDTPLGEDGSLRWYIQQLEMKIKPMMSYIGNTLDALGVFYHEFISYSSGDGPTLGIVLTPQHITEFMCDVIGVDKMSRVIDICCGSGSFLVAAMGKMFRQAASDGEIEYIRKNNLWGVELDPDIHVLALTNMIIRKDGKSHIYQGDAFSDKLFERLRAGRDTRGSEIHFNKGLLNPPYSQQDHTELEFIERELEIIDKGGEVAAICPMSCAIGTKFKEERRRLMERHTLKAVFSMPDDLFYTSGTSTNTCVMVWEAGTPHLDEAGEARKPTFFGYFKDDGFVKRKKLGRIDAYGKWEAIKKEWLRLYSDLEVKDGMSARRRVGPEDEWLCEAYMETDYTGLTQQDFQDALNSYLAYLVKEGQVS